MRRYISLVFGVVLVALLAASCAIGPQSLTVAPGNGQITLSWAQSSGVDGCQLTGNYQVEWAQGSTMPSTGFSSATATTSTYTVTGLTNGTQYVFTVKPLGTTAVGSTCSGVGATTVGTPTGSGIVPPQNPASNLAPSDTFLQACSSDNLTPACLSLAMSELDRDRAQENVAPMTLPSDFLSLTVEEQMFVLSNLERVDRGLSPLEGLASAIDQCAQEGANAGTDPPFTCGSGWEVGGGIWYGGDNIFAADQAWMYDDGYGSNNLSCTSPSDSGCWGHRDNILGAYAAPALMGAGLSTTGGVAEQFVAPDSNDSTYFTWSQVTPDLPVGLSQTSLAENAPVGGSAASDIAAWASGEAMNVTATVVDGGGEFFVAPSSCDLAAGQQCQFEVRFAPLNGSTATANLVITGPNGSQSIPMTGSVP